jgi:hypothetical protein
VKPEEIDHINLVNWFDETYPELEPDFHHFANERFLIPKADGSHWQAGRKLKRMNVKKGVADFFLALPMNGNHGLWLELKVGNNKPSKEQAAFLARKTQRGYVAVAVWGFEAAKEIISFYLLDYTTFREQNEPKNLFSSKSIC